MVCLPAHGSVIHLVAKVLELADGARAPGRPVEGIADLPQALTEALLPRILLLIWDLSPMSRPCLRAITHRLGGGVRLDRDKAVESVNPCG